MPTNGIQRPFEANSLRYSSLVGLWKVDGAVRVLENISKHEIVKQFRRNWRLVPVYTWIASLRRLMI